MTHAVISTVPSSYLLTRDVVHQAMRLEVARISIGHGGDVDAEDNECVAGERARDMRKSYSPRQNIVFKFR